MAQQLQSISAHISQKSGNKKKKQDEIDKFKLQHKDTTKAQTTDSNLECGEEKTKEQQPRKEKKLKTYITMQGQETFDQQTPHRMTDDVYLFPSRSIIHSL